MIITAVRSFCFLLLSCSKFFSSEVDDIFYFVFRKIFFLIRLYFNHDDGKFEKKEKQRTILRQSYRILSRVRCLFVLRLKKYKHIKPPWTVFFFINIYIYIYISITMISMIFIFCPLLSILLHFFLKWIFYRSFTILCHKRRFSSWRIELLYWLIL